jgi:predicted PurR-regulated permease PerM
MNLDKPTIKKILLISAAIVFMLWIALNHKVALSVVGYVLGLFLPLFIGMCMAFMLNVFMNFFERRLFDWLVRKAAAHPHLDKFLLKTKRFFSLILTLLLIAGIITFVLVMIIPNLEETVKWIAKQTPALVDSVQHWVNSLLERFGYSGNIKDIIGDDWKTVSERVIDFVKGSGIIQGTASTVLGVFSTLTNLVMGFVFALYILLTKETLGRQVSHSITAIFPEKIQTRIFDTAKLSKTIFEKFIGGQCIEAVIIGTLTAIGSFFINPHFAVMLGVLVGFTALIPVIGAFIGVIFGALILLIASPWQALAFVIFIIILQSCENHFIYPKVVGKSIGLPGMWVLLAVLVGASVNGIIGIIVFVPLTSVLYVLAGNAVKRRNAAKADAVVIPKS